MKVMISGSSGLIGSTLSTNLQDSGHEVVTLPRTYEESLDFYGVDAVVHLAGESIADRRWTAEKKKRIKESRVKSTLQLSEQLSNYTNPPSVFICASAIGFYGNRGNEQLDESSGEGEGFLSAVCQEWEKATNTASESGIRTINIRTGIVLSKQGGALKKMLLPFKLGCGGKLGTGLQYMSWISLDDVVNVIRFLIKAENVSGAVNLVSPNPVTNIEFTKTLGHVLHRPTILPLPSFSTRIIFGEMADSLLLGSCRVIPKKLIDAGYVFKHTDLHSTLEYIFN